MNPPSNLLERLSPRPVVCPLVRLGHSSSSADETVTSTENSYREPLNYNYHPQYIDLYRRNNLDRGLCNNNKSHAKEQTPEQYYHHQTYSYLDEDLYGRKYDDDKPTNYELSSFSLDTNYWDNDHYNMDKSNGREKKKLMGLDVYQKLDKTKSNLDQGYHTLISPNPVQNWNENGNLYKGKTYQNKDNYFDRLSDDLILKIFSYLSSIDLSVCARICRRFDILAWTPTLWRTISLESENVCGDKAIRGVLRLLCGQGRTGACPSVERVYVNNGAKLTDKSLLLLAKRCPELTHLQIQSCQWVTNNALSEIVTRCNNLQHLDVTGCIKISCLNVNSGLESPRKLQLQYLDLTDCPALQDTSLKIIVRSCPQLAYLYLRRCIQITDAGLKFVPSFCSSLRELSVSDCANITDFGLYELAKLGATLRYLSIAKCDQISDAGLKVVARRCYKLRYLNARGCEAVSDDAVTVLARSCTRLRALDIGKCDVSDAGLRALAESCPNLKKLSLRNCDLITDRGVQCIAYYCRGLQQLNIQDCQITLEGYRAVKRYCKRCVIEHTNPGFF